MAGRKRRRRKSSGTVCVTVTVGGHRTRMRKSKKTGRFTGKCK